MPPKGEVDGYKWKPSTESSGGPTTQAPGPKQLEDAVNKSVNPSDQSDRSGSRHQGNSNPKFEFGGEKAKTEVRKDAKGTDGDGHTSQRVPWQPLDLPTRIAPPTGKTDNLQGPTCGQNRHSCRNDLGICENKHPRAVKERKGQLSAKESKAHLVQLKRTRTRAAVLNTAQRPQRSHVTQVTWSMHVTTQQGDSPCSTTHLLAAATSGPRPHLIK